VESASDKDEQAVAGGGLRINGDDLVLHALEGDILRHNAIRKRKERQYFNICGVRLLLLQRKWRQSEKRAWREKSETREDVAAIDN